MVVVLAAMGLFVLQIALPNGAPGGSTAWLVVGILAAGALAAAAFIHVTSINASRITGESLTLNRVHPDFAAAVRFQRHVRHIDV